jgi:hypothetical protein
MSLPRSLAPSLSRFLAFSLSPSLLPSLPRDAEDAQPRTPTPSLSALIKFLILLGKGWNARAFALCVFVGGAGHRATVRERFALFKFYLQ